MATEKDLQNKTITALREVGYQYSGDNWDEKTLQDNFINKILHLNKNKLPNGLTPAETNRLLSQLPSRFRNAYSILRHGLSFQTLPKQEDCLLLTLLF